jgi:SRSO17 transposase
VDKRWFLPEVWWTDASAARRTTCHVPDALTFQSKPQLAAAMLHAIAQERLLPCKYVVADCLYGNSPDFLDAIEACVGITALVAISSETRCWRQSPQTEEKTYKYKQAARVTRCKEGLPERTVWLGIKRTLGSTPEYSY